MVSESRGQEKAEKTVKKKVNEEKAIKHRQKASGRGISPELIAEVTELPLERIIALQCTVS